MVVGVEEGKRKKDALFCFEGGIAFRAGGKELFMSEMLRWQ